MDGLYEQIRIAIHTIWRRRWLALAVAWGLCVAGWLAVALIPNSYESTARVYAQMQTILPDKMGITPAERANDLLRVKQTLTSTENLEKVVRRTDLNLLIGSERDLSAQVEKLRENIKITAQQDNLFEITATSGVGGFSNAQNARTSSAIVQNLLDLFVEENLSGDRAETGQSLTFLDEELRRRERQLQEAEQRRVEFETRFMGMLPGEGSIDQRMSAARVELANVEQQLMTAQSSLQALRGQMAGIPATISTPNFASAPSAAGVGYATAQLGALRLSSARPAPRAGRTSHPDVVTTRAQIERLRPAAAAERASAPSGGASTISTPNPSFTSLRAMAAEREAQVAAASARKNQLVQAMTQLASKQAEEPGMAAEQSRLNRDYEVLKRQYDKLLEDREQVRLRSDVQTKTDAVNFRILEPPSRPNVPVAPNRPLLLTLILLAAIAAGAGAAFVRGQLQATFTTQKRLEQITGLPVLGTVGEVVTCRGARHDAAAAEMVCGRRGRFGRQLRAPDAGRILATQHGRVKGSPMNQHSSLKRRGSLLERASELYDFNAAIRAPMLPDAVEQPAPPAPEPVPVAAEAPAEAAPKKRKAPLVLSPPEAEPEPTFRPIEEAEDVAAEADILALDSFERAVPEPSKPAARRAPVPSRSGTVDREGLLEDGYILPDAPVSALAEEFASSSVNFSPISDPAAASRGQAPDGAGLFGPARRRQDFLRAQSCAVLAGERDVEALLVDGDFAKPEILSILGLESGPGLIDAIQDPDADPNAFVIRTDIEGLSVLPAGKQANNVTELLASARTRDVLAALTRDNPRRVVIFDSPPALMASPASVLAGQVGQVVLVVRADQTTEADLKEAVSLMSGCEHVSLLLNGAGFRRQRPPLRRLLRLRRMIARRALFALCATTAFAAPAAAQLRTGVQPYIEVQQVLSAELDGGDVLTYTALAAGVDAGVETRRVRAQISYRYERRFAWEDNLADNDVHTGIAQLSADLVPNLIRVNAGALATRARGDGGGPIFGLNSFDSPNISEVYSFYAGPDLSTRVGDLTLNGSYRFGLVEIDNKFLRGVPLAPGALRLDRYSSSTNHSLSASVGMGVGSLPFGWTVGGGYFREDVDRLDQKFEGGFVRADVVVPVTATVALTAGAGYEKIESSQQDIVRDSAGRPVVTPGGRLVGDPNKPRLLAYETDGFIWDAGVIWRPSRRTELQARIGRRYGGTTVIGSFSHQLSSRLGVRASVYDGVESFGRLLVADLASVPWTSTSDATRSAMASAALAAACSAPIPAQAPVSTTLSSRSLRRIFAIAASASSLPGNMACGGSASAPVTRTAVTFSRSRTRASRSIAAPTNPTISTPGPSANSAVRPAWRSTPSPTGTKAACRASTKLSAPA
jgi:polysaccharide chain length determinant protein (PEP-CTERM system associated)